MNHKRKRPKNQRAGCLMCKPWKANGAKKTHRDKRRSVLDGADSFTYYRREDGVECLTHYRRDRDGWVTL